VNDTQGGWEPLGPDFFTASEFDLLEQEKEIRNYLHEKLRDQYHLEPGDANAAADRYLGFRIGPLPENSDLIGAADDAYTKWASVTDPDPAPGLVELRESAQQLAAWESHTASHGSNLAVEGDAASHQPSPDGLAPGTILQWLGEAITTQLEAEATGPGSKLYNPADLAGAAATLAELHADLADAQRGQRPDLAQQDELGSAAGDLAAAEAAITLLRENRDRHGYTEEDAVTARVLRGVLDSAQVWDHAAPAAQPWTTEVELRPDRVRSRPGSDDTVIQDAGFAGAVITIQRTPGATTGAAAGYVILVSGPGGRGPLRDVDTTGIGVIAAGVRAPRPARADVCADLGAQVRQHPMRLADAVAIHRKALRDRESRRAETAQIAQISQSRPDGERSL
jgi:hypothetical protein